MPDTLLTSGKFIPEINLPKRKNVCLSLYITWRSGLRMCIFWGLILHRARRRLIICIFYKKIQKKDRSLQGGLIFRLLLCHLYWNLWVHKHTPFEAQRYTEKLVLTQRICWGFRISDIRAQQRLWYVVALLRAAMCEEFPRTKCAQQTQCFDSYRNVMLGKTWIQLKNWWCLRWRTHWCTQRLYLYC